MFPDAVTTRGTKHLHELMRLTGKRLKTCIFFLVQRMDADRFSPAAHIDPIYGDALMQAARTGVMVLVYQAEVRPDGNRYRATTSLFPVVNNRRNRSLSNPFKGGIYSLERIDFLQK